LRRTNLTVLHSGTNLYRQANSFDAASRLSTVSGGANSATYFYLSNSPLVDHIVFARPGAPVMTNQKKYRGKSLLAFSRCWRTGRDEWGSLLHSAEAWPSFPYEYAQPQC
jgi:hypothetical protein